MRVEEREAGLSRLLHPGYDTEGHGGGELIREGHGRGLGLPGLWSPWVKPEMGYYSVALHPLQPKAEALGLSGLPWVSDLQIPAWEVDFQSTQMAGVRKPCQVQGLGGKGL